MAAVIAAVLALAGAPANTQVVCNPSLAPSGATKYLRTPPSIELGPIPCAGLLLAGATPDERVKLAALNPDANFDALIGAGLMIALHEAFHAGLRSGDETLVECHAMAHIEELLNRWGPSPAAELAWARTEDSLLPPEYRRGC